jgi:C-terminal processing protease CtpA/Prc
LAYLIDYRLCQSNGQNGSESWPRNFFGAKPELAYTLAMHQRTWLTLLTFPLIVAFTVPMFHKQEQRQAIAMQRAAPGDDPLAGLADIQDVIAHIRNSYVEVPDLGKVLDGGIQGALERASLLNSYLSPEETQLPSPGMGETGLTLVKDKIIAYVVGVAPNSPAAHAGFQIGDWVRKMDNEPISSMSHWAMERRLRGQVGSELEILRMAAGTREQKKVAIKREKLKHQPVSSSVGTKAAFVALHDLGEGRAAELKAALKAADSKLPIVLDIRNCPSGVYVEAAKVASILGCSGTFATLQEVGQPDAPLAVPPNVGAPFREIAVLIGQGTMGPAETLAFALKNLAAQASAPEIVFLGERTHGNAVELKTLLLRQGGAVEIVAKRWMGAGGERLDLGLAGGQLRSSGLVPDYSLRGVPDNEDFLPRILEALEKGPIKPKDGPRKVALLRHETPESPLRPILT